MNNTPKTIQAPKITDFSGGKRISRNGKIDLLRFFFCISVILLHIEGVLGSNAPAYGYFTLAHHGYIGVEFFFLVSGWLMAKKLESLDAKPADLNTLGGETYRFLWGKLKPIIPYHIIFAISMLVLWGYFYPSSMGKILLERSPSLLFLHRSGINGANPKDVLGLEWYIFSMLLGMAFLYPLGRRYKRAFRALSPVLGMLICGSLMIKTGTLNNAYSVLGVTYKCNWRALGELMIGMGCYEATCAFDRKDFSSMGKVLLALLELICYALVGLYIFGSLDNAYDMYALVLLAVAVSISFSKKGFAANWKLFNHPFFGWLDKNTLPIYLAQTPFLAFTPLFAKDATPLTTTCIIFFGTLLSGILLSFPVEAIQKAKKHK